MDVFKSTVKGWEERKCSHPPVGWCVILPTQRLRICFSVKPDMRSSVSFQVLFVCVPACPLQGFEFQTLVFKTSAFHSNLGQLKHKLPPFKVFSQKQHVFVNRTEILTLYLLV